MECPHNVSVAWLVIGATVVLLRTAWLAHTRRLPTGLVWMSKIQTDPFHDVVLYWRTPLWLLRGQFLDPMRDVRTTES